MASKRSGFTLVELLVVVAIITVIVALVLPAVQQAREAANRTSCRNKLKQIGVALHGYHETHRVFPPGFVQSNVTDASQHVGFAWGIFLLPGLDQQGLYEKLNFNSPACPNKTLPVWRCPSDNGTEKPATWTSVSVGAEVGDCTVITGTPPAPVTTSGQTAAQCASAGGTWVGSGTYQTSRPAVPYASRASYVGNFGSTALTSLAGSTGVFAANSRVTSRDITDGLSNTFLVGERDMTLGQATYEGVHYDLTGGTLGVPSITPSQSNAGRVVLGSVQPGRPNSSGSSGFSSKHSGGCHMLLADGSVRFVPQTINATTWTNLGNRQDGNAISEF